MSESTEIAIIGHRGARGEAPENTLAGFEQGVKAGVQGIELDIRLSADQELVVIHDNDTRRTTAKAGRVNQLTHHELAALDARHDTPGWPDKTGIPTLNDVVSFCPDHLTFQFEVKGDKTSVLSVIAKKLADFIQQHQLGNRVTVTSSHSGFLKLMAKALPGQSLGYVCQYRYRQPISRSRTLSCDWLIAHYSLVNHDLMKHARHNGLKVSVWTVNDLAEAERLVKLSVRSLITDFPTAFIAHFHSAV